MCSECTKQNLSHTQNCSCSFSPDFLYVTQLVLVDLPDLLTVIVADGFLLFHCIVSLESLGSLSSLYGATLETASELP